MAKLANLTLTFQMPIAGPSRLPLQDPLPSTPIRQYQFVMQNPGGQGTPRNRLPLESVEPSRNICKNKQRANAILYTPRSHRHAEAQNQSVFDSPTPATSATRLPESLTGDSGSDEQKSLFSVLIWVNLPQLHLVVLCLQLLVHSMVAQVANLWPRNLVINFARTFGSGRKKRMVEIFVCSASM